MGGTGVPPTDPPRPSLGALARVFGLLGVIGFGGPAVHVSLLRRLVVERHRWLGADEFADMFAACNLIPGPSSTELAVFIAYRLGGGRALALAAGLFILPAAALMLALAWAYSRFGADAPVAAALHLVRPLVVGLVAWATVDLGRRLVRRRRLLVLSAAFALIEVAGWIPALLPPGLGLERLQRLPAVAAAFLEIGAISFGSGYVLLPLLRSEFVGGLHWLTDRQLLDAVAFGQVTPGPVFTTATFLGFLFAGVAGALVATAAIFAPGLALVPFLNRIVKLASRHAWVRWFVDAANAAALGLIAGAAVVLGRAAVTDAVTAALAVAAFAVLLRLG